MGRPKKQPTDAEGTQEDVTVETTDDSNTVNWRNLIPKEYIVANQQYFSDLSRADLLKLDTSEIPDNKLLILLAGIKEVAKMYGYRSVEYKNDYCSHNFIAKTCRIVWDNTLGTQDIGNKEQIVFESCADASAHNTFSWYGNFLSTAAENRSFVRCVRNFLGIHILGQDEMGPLINDSDSSDSNNYNPTPHNVLEKVMAQHNITFEKLKSSCSKFDEYVNSESWESVQDIPKNKVLSIITKIKDKKPS